MDENKGKETNESRDLLVVHMILYCASNQDLCETISACSSAIFLENM